MKTKIILLLFFWGISNISYSQTKFGAELSEGFVFFDYFNKFPKDYKDVFFGYGIQSELVLWANIYTVKNAKFGIGAGYTNFYYLDYGSYFFFSLDDVLYSSYLNVKFCTIIKPDRSRVGFLIKSSNYILLHKMRQNYMQNRMFSNIDLGIQIKLFNNTNLNISSPITIVPVQSGISYFGKLPNGETELFNTWVELTGLNIGIKYGFGGNKS